MKHYYLCGHTGSNNRGCDAIVRSTAGILASVAPAELTLMTFAPQQDKDLGLDAAVQLRPYPRKTPAARAASYVMRRFFNNGVWGQRCLHRELMKEATQDDILLNIGGDTYCYDSPYISYALNEMAAERGIPTVFWGCSVDDRLLRDRQMQEDVNRYAHIVTRETLSYEILRKCVSDAGKVHLACDPAFTLMPEETPLPDRFIPGNTVGINISPLVCGDYRNEQDMMYQNVTALIDYILESSDMGVCLIPHVYDIRTGSQDLEVMRIIYGKYANEERVSVVRENLNSGQLKHIIAQCRFYIGARTHSMIAAYSSQVPALALSYSVKSLGIARDIFGTHEGYAIAWQDFDCPTQLRDAFIKTLQENESWILTHYRNMMPQYRQQITEVTREIFG